MNIIRVKKPCLQQGFSLVEVLVAAVIFSFGLGGLSLMLMTAVHGTVEARNRTAAQVQASELAQLIAMSPSTSGHYINPVAAPLEDCFAPSSCSEVAWAAGNLARWQFELERNLAQATGLVCLDSTPYDGQGNEPACDGSGDTVVKVFWEEAFHVTEVNGGSRRVVLPLAR
ncbi:MAG TPA: type IV pilus modification protein PilV [Xanthomonadales bacterium]|nr:type IV pilus modification protein PilV [Xanthomonadales bacterium]